VEGVLAVGFFPNNKASLPTVTEKTGPWLFRTGISLT